MQDADDITAEPIRRYGVVAVILRESRFLVIRRSQQVLAPGKYCFPGGGIESGETEPLALARELLEELNVPIVPQQCLVRFQVTCSGKWPSASWGLSSKLQTAFGC